MSARENAPRALYNRIRPGYFQAMGTRLIHGRDFTEQDDEKAARVAIVNETFARRFWPGEDPLGKRFSLGGTDARSSQVVGVAEDGKYAGLERRPEAIRLSPDLAILLRVNEPDRPQPDLTPSDCWHAFAANSRARSATADLERRTLVDQ